MAIAGDLTFGQLSAGDDHSCGKTTDGAGYCWGANFWGELGDGTRAYQLVPTPLVAPT